MTCGETLKLVRKWKRLSQRKLADKIKTSQQYISELEKCRHFNGNKLEKLLKAMNITKTEWETFRKLPPPH
ncbi:MAG TPA: helix-turn-helix transcriptional regulator [Chitinophagaceae bacterium]|nr:helix-turn-helix transcriptional regulator [Chitinophagaceae bacterium]